MLGRRIAVKRWRVRPPAPAGFLAELPLPPLVRQLLYQRGVGSVAEARRFFLEEAPASDPNLLPQAREAQARLRSAIVAGETIAVYGDFDADGITAAALLTQALRELEAQVVPYIPDRFSEGYGLNAAALTTLRQEGATVLITADCGTSSVAEVAHAADLGMDAIILDHHSLPAAGRPVGPGPGVPAAPFALVNPKRADSAYPFAELASVGVSYRLMEGLYGVMGRPFSAQRFLDLVALGTVADVVPLVGENRYLVSAGLRALAAAERPGVRALAAAAGLSLARLDAEGIGYGLAPRLNAAGRLAHGGLSFRLLTAEDESEAAPLAQRLDQLNRERQYLTAQAMTLAEDLLEREEDSTLIFIGHAEIPLGIAGLVAGRLAEELGRPTIVYSQGERESRGSARSVPGFDIAAALRRFGHLMVRFGGHQQAAGFTATNEALPSLKASLQAHAEEALAEVEPGPVLEIDAEVPLREIRGEEIRWLRRFQPCGAGNPEPTFLSRDVLVADARSVGAEGQHLRLKLRDGPVAWPAIAFRRPDPSAGSGQALEVRRGDAVDVVYSLAAGRDDSLELRVHDLRPAQP